ncbi:MAG: hypothetical protein LN410_03015, partial [Candidatus Thermoplasmatota archaeon]|nr:hypothetical protein [Candidatus Thermoplasmatota archaeon]
SSITVVLSFYMASQTGYEYAPLVSFRTYNSVLVGSALVLIGTLTAGLLTLLRVDAQGRSVLLGVETKLRREVEWPVSTRDAERLAREFVTQGPESAATVAISEDLKVHDQLTLFRTGLRTLLAAPLGLLAAIFGISAWALPAEVFLQNLPLVNTTLLFFVSYGLVVAVAAVVAVVAVMLSTRAVAST